MNKDKYSLCRNNEYCLFGLSRSVDLFLPFFCRCKNKYDIMKNGYAKIDDYNKGGILEMRKILSIMVFSVLLVACGTGNDQEPNQPPVENEEPANDERDQDDEIQNDDNLRDDDDDMLEDDMMEDDMMDDDIDNENDMNDESPEDDTSS